VFVEPMKAVLVDNLPKGEDWGLRIESDGVRGVGAQTRQGIN